MIGTKRFWIPGLLISTITTSALCFILHIVMPFMISFSKTHSANTGINTLSAIKAFECDAFVFPAEYFWTDGTDYGIFYFVSPIKRWLLNTIFTNEIEEQLIEKLDCSFRDILRNGDELLSQQMIICLELTALSIIFTASLRRTEIFFHL